MFWVRPQATGADTLAYVDSLPTPGSLGGDGIGIWGLKFGMDGGVEGGYLCQPYANNLTSAGTRSGRRTTSSRWWSSRQPVLTLVGGRPVHDPEGLCRLTGRRTTARSAQNFRYPGRAGRYGQSQSGPVRVLSWRKRRFRGNARIT